MDAVIEIKATKVATKPKKGIFDPISNPKTNEAPMKPKKAPIHCLNVTFSFKIGPLSKFVKIGCNVTIKAAIPAGIPIEIEKKTPPK